MNRRSDEDSNSCIAALPEDRNLGMSEVQWQAVGLCPTGWYHSLRLVMFVEELYR